MNADFVQEVAIATIVCLSFAVIGRVILAHPISRRWNPDWDGILSDWPLYLAMILGAAFGLFGQTAYMIGLILGLLLPILFLKLAGQEIPRPYSEPLPPLPKRTSRADYD